MVLNQTRPLVFTSNEPGMGRVPKPVSRQLVELRYAIAREYALVDKADSTLDGFTDLEISEPETNLNVEPETSTEPETEPKTEPETEPESEKPSARGKRKIREEIAYFLKRVREIRAFCLERERLGEAVDSLGMRPAEACWRLIPRGIPADFLLYAMTMHWPKDTRADAGVFTDTPEEFSNGRLREFSAQIMAERGIPTGEFHALFGYILILAEAKQPIQLIGPHGTGKSFLAEQIARYLDLNYGETPMTPGATRGDLLGRHTIGGFVPSEYCEIYSGGGVFNFEEIDASDPSMLIVLNNSLANERLFNSSNGERYEKHADFTPVSTANTFSLGATKDYTGREKIDAASNDRWRMGRVFVPLDEAIEEKIAYGLL